MLRTRPLPGDASAGSERTRTGILLALVTALISGVAVYVNGIAVRAVADATLYTTVKNLLAAAVLLGVAVAATVARRPSRPRRPRTARDGVGLVAVAIVGGSVPFLLFFEGLSRASSTQAAFLHKTLVVWVALLAVPLLGERVRGLHITAIGLVLAGYLLAAGGVDQLRADTGTLMVLLATLLWSAEVVVDKRLLRRLPAMTVGLARMLGGGAALLGWSAATGHLAGLGALDGAQWAWLLLASGLLAGYVGSWLAALARAPAVDVTAVLVLGAVVTAVLQGVVDGASLEAPALALLATGSLVAAIPGLKHRQLQPAPRGD